MGNSLGRAQSSMSLSVTTSSCSPCTSKVLQAKVDRVRVSRFTAGAINTRRSNTFRRATLSCTKPPKEKPARITGKGPYLVLAQSTISAKSSASPPLLCRVAARAHPYATEVGTNGYAAQLIKGFGERLNHFVFIRAAEQRMRVGNQRNAAPRFAWVVDQGIEPCRRAHLQATALLPWFSR